MITNNKFIRGDIGVFNNQVSSYINIEDYEREKANKYLVTKEYLNKQINGGEIKYIMNKIILKEDIKDFRYEEREKLFIWDVYIICQEIDNNDYFINEGQNYYGVNNYFMKIKETYDEARNIYIYTIDTTKKYNLENNTLYFDASTGHPYNNLLICLNSKYIIPIIPYYNEIETDNEIDIKDNNNNVVGELTSKHYIDYYNYIKSKNILINSIFKIELNSNITSNKNYGCILESLNNFYSKDKSNNDIDINFLKYVFLLKEDALFYFIDLNNLDKYKNFIKLSSLSDVIEEEEILYFLAITTLQLINNKMVNISLNATCFDGTYNDSYNYSEHGNKLIVSNEQLTIENENENNYDNIHFTIKGTYLNTMSTSISSEETEHTFILKKITTDDDIMVDSSSSYEPVIPNLSTTFFNKNITSDDYLDNAVGYRYILMEKYETNEKILAFNKTSGVNYTTDYYIVLYHKPTNIFFVPITYTSKIPITSGYSYTPNTCYMPLNHFNDVQNGLEIKNKVGNTFGNNISKAMFLNKFEISSLTSDSSNSSNSSDQYINSSNIPQTYIKNNYLLSNWTTDEDYFNVQTEYDINVMYNYNPPIPPSPGFH